MRIHPSLVALAVVSASGLVAAQGRGGGAEWPTTSGDAQRSSWIRTDANISVDSLSKPGFELQWKTKLDNQPRQGNSLAAGVTVNGVTLFTPLAIITGSSNNVYAVDTDTGSTFWQRHFDAALPSASTAACPGGITSAATRMANLAPPPLPAARGAGAGGGGRGGTGYRGAVGEPGEGVPAELTQRGGGGGGGRAAAPQLNPPPPGVPVDQPLRGAPPAGGAPVNPAANPAPGGSVPAAPGAAQAQAGGGRGAAGQPGRGAAGGPGAAAPGGGGGFGRASGTVYALASDGMLHTLGLPSGKDMAQPTTVVPANARLSDPIAVNDMLYVVTTGSCSGVPDGVWAMPLAGETRSVVSWKTNGGSPVGSMAFAPDGTLFVAIGAGQAATGGYSSAIVALDPKTLQVKDWFTQPTADFVSGPIVFKFNDKDLVAAATRDGRILLLDATALGGPGHSTALHESRRVITPGAAFAPQALTMWQEVIPVPGAAAAIPAAPAAPGGAPVAPATPAFELGMAWLLVPVAGRPAADLASMNGTVTNGAVVALRIANSAGKPSLEQGWVSRDLAAPVAPIVVNGVVFAASGGKGPSTPAVLYALDGRTGKELWNSGKTITSYMPGRNLWSGNSQVYVGAFDGTVYAFGFAMERK
jgi:outer membrane protein assembly factor BamB